MTGGAFRLITSVKRGNGPNLPERWQAYDTIEAARIGAARLMQHERVVRVMIVRNEVPGAFVEWIG